MIGDKPVHIAGILQSGCTGGDFFQIRDVGSIRGNEKEDGGSPHIFFEAGDGEIYKVGNGLNLDVVSG